MNAKEMFEELGYDIRTIDGDGNIIFTSLIQNNYSFILRRIGFDTSKKRFVAEEGLMSMFIDMSTFKAIMKQCEELGWLDE